MKTPPLLGPCLLLLVTASCAVGPDYRRPAAAPTAPADWRWKAAEPRDAVPKGAWWNVFNDDALARLETNALAITRERESGTMENLLSMPTRPFEVMIGKIIPYILVGYIQISLLLIAARFLFHVPMIGSLLLLFAAALIFIAANLSMGITFSTIAQNQRQAMQMGMFFFLPSILLSGFMFPFRGMPHWAQAVGEILPLTHFLRVVRGILLKGNGLAEIAPHLWPIALFTAVVLAIGVKRYRQTLD